MSVETVYRLVLGTGRLPDDPRAAPVDLREVRRAFVQSAPWDGAAPILLAIACVLLGCGLLCALRLYRRRDEHPPPLLTYLRLSRRLGLLLGDQFMLWGISRVCRLPNPMTLMLCPATFDHHARSYLTRYPDAIARRKLTRLQSIRKRLYPGDSPELG